MKDITVNDVRKMRDKGILQIHHDAWARGYLKRKPNNDGSYGYVYKYNGRFGRGYEMHIPSWSSSTYHFVRYYIYK